MQIQGSVPRSSGAFMTIPTPSTRLTTSTNTAAIGIGGRKAVGAAAGGTAPQQQQKRSASSIGTVGGVRRAEGGAQMQNTFSAVFARPSTAATGGGRSSSSSYMNHKSINGNVTASSSFTTSLRKGGGPISNTSAAHRSSSAAAANLSTAPRHMYGFGSSSHGGASSSSRGSAKDQSGLAQSFLQLQKQLVALGYANWSIIREADVYGGVLFPFACFIRFLLQEGAPDVSLSLMTTYDWFLVEESDERLIAALYRVLAERFSYRPAITAAQFCQASPLSSIPTAMSASAGGLAQRRSLRSSSATAAIIPTAKSPSSNSGRANHAGAKIAIVRDVISLFMKAKAALDKDAARLQHLYQLEYNRENGGADGELMIGGGGGAQQQQPLFLTDVRRDADRTRLGEVVLAKSKQYHDVSSAAKHHHDPTMAMVTVSGGADENADGGDFTANPLVQSALLALRKRDTAKHSSTASIHNGGGYHHHDAAGDGLHSTNKKAAQLLPWQEGKDRFGQRTGQSMVSVDPSLMERRGGAGEHYHHTQSHLQGTGALTSATGASNGAAHYQNNTSSSAAGGVSSSSACCRHLAHGLTRDDPRAMAAKVEAQRLSMLHSALNRVTREALPQ